jgi:hypothetical protein
VRPRDARARGNNQTRNDDPNHDRLGRRSIRGDAPHAPPQPHRDPTLLQHERLYQLSRRRSDDRDRDLPDLRLHPTPPLSPRAGAVRRRPRRVVPCRGGCGVQTTASEALSRKRPRPGSVMTLKCQPGRRLVENRRSSDWRIDTRRRRLSYERMETPRHRSRAPGLFERLGSAHSSSSA